MSRATTAGFVAALVLGVLGLGVQGLRVRSEAQTLGVLPLGPVAKLGPGDRVCQSPIGLAEDTEAVFLSAGGPTADSPAIDVTVSSVARGERLGTGRLPPGFDRTKPHEVNVGRVEADRDIEVCLRNRGPGRAWIRGDEINARFCSPAERDSDLEGPLGCRPGYSRPTVTTSTAKLNGKPLVGDLSLAFVGERPSLLGAIPNAFERAARFRPPVVGSWTFWLLGGLVLVVAPLLLLWASRVSER